MVTPGPYLQEDNLVYALEDTRVCNRMSFLIQGGVQYKDRFGQIRTSDEERRETATFARVAMTHHNALVSNLKRALEALNKAPKFKVDSHLDSYTLAASLGKLLEEIAAEPKERRFAYARPQEDSRESSPGCSRVRYPVGNP